MMNNTPTLKESIQRTAMIIILTHMPVD